MNIRGHLIAKKAQDTLQRVANNGCAQMTNMHRLGNIGAAKIKDQVLRIFDRSSFCARGICTNALCSLCQGRIADADIQKAGASYIDRRDHRILRNSFGDLGRYFARIAPCGFGPC